MCQKQYHLIECDARMRPYSYISQKGKDLKRGWTKSFETMDAMAQQSVTNPS